MNFTGKASIDKPWLNFYPEGLRNLDVPKITIESFLKMKNPDENKIAFEYYGNKITWKQLWEEVDIAARALKLSVLKKETESHPSWCPHRHSIFFFWQQKELV